jgi:hypothetical protein
MLLTAIFTSGILGMVLLSYLTLARSQQVSSVSSQGWQKSILFAEAGVEEALAKINGAGVSAGSAPSVSPFAIHRDLGNGSYDIQVLAGPGASATIYATGYVAIPILSNVVSRAIVVTTTNSSMFTMSVAAVSNVIMSGRASGNFSDSFDSTDPKGTIRKNGEVACFNGELNLGSATIISGDLLLGPLATNLSGRVSGQTYHDLNIDLPEVLPPSPYWLPAPFANKSIDGTDYRYVFNYSGEYTINIPGSIYVGPAAKVTLQVQSVDFLAPDITVAGINQRAGELVIYALQPGFTFGDVTVESGKASNLVYLGTPGNTSLIFSNNNDFTGIIYAPDANFTDNVGKAHGRKADFTGSLIAKSVRINGSASFHFDEDLQRDSPVGRGFIVTSWKEL